MISLRRCKMAKAKITKEEVEEMRKNLEEATKEIFIQLRKARLKSWYQSRLIVLD